MNVSGGHLSKEFFELVKAIGESRSKQEEDRIILAEIVTLKQRLNEAQVPAAKMREYLVRSLYIEMLGHDASFAYIHAVKLSHDRNLLCKRIGYLTCSLCLDNEHELLLLLINTIQKDLSSSNHLEIAAALDCITKLVNQEMIPAVFTPVLNLMVNHSNELIRKKCCMVLHALYKIQPELIIAEARDATRRVLCDPDPSVMSASLHLIHELAKHDKDGWKDLVPSLVSILKQITEHRLPRDYDYHRIPAPWIQIKLLSVLATLGEGDQQASEHMQEVLVEVLRRAELGANVGFAIIYECVKTMTAIYPSSRLLDLAANSISRFISADNHNLKYVGITGLAAIVRVHPTFAAQPEHQIVVLDCLEDVDETLKRRTLELLYRMTNPINAGAVVDKLLSHLRMSVDVDFRRDLVSKITRLADRFAPSPLWYVQTINAVFELGGTLVAEETAHNLLRLIAEGPTGESESDETFRQDVVNEYIRLAERASALPDVLVKVAAWCIGEYGTLNNVDGYSSLESLLLLLCESIERTYDDATTRTWIISAIMKLSILRLLAIISPNVNEGASDLFSNAFAVDDVVNGTLHLGGEDADVPKWPPRHERLITEVDNVLNQYRYSQSTDIESRSREFQKLIIGPEPGTPIITLHLLRELFPFDGACEDIVVDVNLSFLDDYVSSCIAAGARTYCPPSRHVSTKSNVVPPPEQPSLALTVSQISCSSGLKFTPYAVPQTPTPEALRHPTHLAEPTVITSTISQVATAPFPGQTTDPTSVFKVLGPRKWGPQGYQGMQQPKSTKSTSPTESTAKLTTMPPSANPSSDSTAEKRQLTERELAARALFSGLLPGAVNYPLGNKGIAEETGSITNSNNRWSKALHQNRPMTASSLSSDDGYSNVLIPQKRKTSNCHRQDSGDLLGLGPSSASHVVQLRHTTDVPQSTNGHTVNNLLEDTPDTTTDTLDFNKTSNDLISDVRSTKSPIVPNSLSCKQENSIDLITSLDELEFSNDPTLVTHTLPSPSHVNSVSSQLRPLLSSTSQVGALWPTLRAERRASLSIHSSFNSIDALFKKLQSLINISIVELIGIEGIGAAQNIATTSSIFLHAKLGIQRVDIIVKGNDEKILQDIVALCDVSLRHA